tara:strand:+ start:678 stop:1028 length:351 start_codon:yes stop_codon:yes gene_type:complete
MNKEIIGDDYPTYEDSVNMTLAERREERTKVLKVKYTTKAELLHRLACVEHDIKIVRNHINRCCKGSFFEPSLNEDGSVFADEAWHNISNIEIACDLNDKSPLDWESRVKNNENKV